jgi:hypothetical protein
VGGISLSSSGSFASTEAFLKKMAIFNITSVLSSSGQAGVNALASATPAESGLAANSWTYEVQADKDSAVIVWHNTDLENGFPVAIMLQYGYATGTGGFVAGRDYINPAIEPIFQQIITNIGKAVTS